jgi:dihydroorotase-like cyclic amidohydrolase
VASAPRADLVLRNALVVTQQGVMRGGIAARDGRIVAIAEDDALPAADELIDCKGRPLLPGLVDPHVHLGGAFPYEQNCRTECESAAAGGVTTLIQYRRSTRYKDGTKILETPSFLETFPRDLETAQANMFLDTAFHFIISTLEQANEIPVYAERFGVRSYKLYMGGYAVGNPIGLVAVDDGVIFRAMEHVRGLGDHAYVMVHAENQGLYLLLTERMKSSGRLDLGAFLESRPPFMEEEAIARAIRLADAARCPLYVVHTTVATAIDMAREARRRGQQVVLETCPHYLTLDAGDERLVRQGPAIGKVGPPSRDAAHREGLWRGIIEGQIQTIGTDHVPLLKTGATVWEERPGFAGLATMLPVMLTEGVLRGRIQLEKVAEVCALNPARTFGLAPRKGAITLGADADVVLVDLDREERVRPEMTHSRYTSAFEELPLRGWPILTVRRGEVIFRDGEVQARYGSGVVLRPGKAREPAMAAV